MAESFRKRFLRNLDSPKIEERRRQALALVDNFIKAGLTPEEINKIVNGLAEKGRLTIPTERTSLVPLPAGQQGPQNQLQEPIKLKTGNEKRPKAAVVFNPDTGTFETPQELPQDTDIEFFRRTSTKAKEKQEKESPEKKRRLDAARKVIETAQTIQANNKDIPDRLVPSLRSALNLVGGELVETEKPGFFGKKKSFEIRLNNKGSDLPDKTMIDKAKIYLRDNGALVTPANIQAVIDRGLVK